MPRADAEGRPGREPPEVEILLGCARTRIDPEVAERVATSIRGGVDWSLLLGLARAHGIIPLLDQGLRSAGAGLVPADVLDRLREECFANAHNSLALTSELLALLDLFREHEIVALPYKGPLLAASAYGRVSLRQFGDLDLMVRRHDFDRAGALLIRRGYRPEATNLERNLGRDASRLSSVKAYHRVFILGETGPVVELHWAFGEEFHGFGPVLWWDRLRTSPLAGRQVPSLAAEDTLAILCMHGTRHRWGRLGWICDIAELIRSHPGFDWERALAWAASLRVRRIVLLGLSLARDNLDASLPDPVLREIAADRAIKPLTLRVRRSLFRKPGGTRGILECPFTHDAITLDDAFFHLRTRERLRDKLRYGRYVAQFCLNPNPNDRGWLPAPLDRLAPMLRPFRLLALYAPIALRKLAGRRPIPGPIDEYTP